MGFFHRTPILFRSRRDGRMITCINSVFMEKIMVFPILMGLVSRIIPTKLYWMILDLMPVTALPTNTTFSSIGCMISVLKQFSKILT